MKIYHCEFTMFGKGLNACVSAESKDEALNILGLTDCDYVDVLGVEEIGESYVEAKIIAEECL